MTSNKKDSVLVVLQMSGAYDALNTIIPYNDPLYQDYRPVLKVDPEQVLAIDDKVGFHPAMAPIKDLYDQGKVAVMQVSAIPTQSLPLPLHGYLAHRRARQTDHGRMAGPGHSGPGPSQRKCAYRGKLRNAVCPGPSLPRECPWPR